MTTPHTPRTIVDVIASPGFGGFFFDDQAAIKAGARRDGAAYDGTTLTPGYNAVREPAESVSIQLVLDDGYIATGDCASVQYSGVGGREPRFHAADLAEAIETRLAPLLHGLEVASFRTAAEKAEAAINSIEGLGRAAAYGISQALLDAAAHTAGHHLMARVIKDEWDLPGALASVPVYGQTGEDRYDNVDKMILKHVPVIPHGLINTPDLLGTEGRALEAYVTWIKNRVRRLSTDPGYRPVIHLDVYGMIGQEAGGSITGTADILQMLERAADPHQLRIEHSIHATNRDEQIQLMGALKAELRNRGSRVQLIADEWANTAEDIHQFAVAAATDLIQIKTPDLGSIHHTVDAILDCHAHGIGPVLGGTCAETDRSARTTTHIGIATGVTQMLAKPGMGFDEGLMIVTNEMNRALRLDAHRKTAGEQRL
ncbi:methylaspartate ammonia-lyase [Paenarthrobacter sp. NPDC090520]|uniref:methylaspartate ammonia-lyase n=1 Tax=Paenarthrobacter sp. NPDC090520 TaxID=3364382 RepID=UPI00382C8349